MDYDPVPLVQRMVAAFGLVCALTIRFAVNLFKISDQFPQIQRHGARHATAARYGNWPENLVLIHLCRGKFGKYVDEVLPVGTVFPELRATQTRRVELVNQEEAQFCFVRRRFD